PARGAGRPDQRVNVPLGRAGRPAPRLAQLDPDDDALGRPVPDAGGRGRHAGWAKSFGLPLEFISAGEAGALFPPMSTDGVLGAAYLPTDGYIDPSQL